MGYPSFDDEVKIMSLGIHEKKEKLESVAEADDIIRIKNIAVSVHVSDAMMKYIVQIISATRSHAQIVMGASPRGSISLYKMCQAFAVYEGRNYVIPDDVKYLAPYVLSHRLILSSAAKINNISPEEIISEIIKNILVPIS